jgi:selenocysteine lyase/cysteine desulfurase
LIGARADEIALTTSTSQGLMTVAEGLPLQAGDQIVVVEDDFPSNQIPWWRQQRRGAGIVVVPRRDGRVSVDALMAAVTPRTRVLAVPWVLFDTGFRLDLPALGAALAAHNARRDPPVLLCVDAIQGLGAFPLDVRACGIDFLSADSHKWMLGVEGIGLFFCRRALVETLDAPFVSWWSMARPFDSYRPGAPLQPDARRWEYACLPTMEIFGLDAALGMLLEAGPACMAARILELTAALAAGLAERGWRVHSPMAGDGERSGILSASHPSLPAREVVAALEGRGVSVAARGPGVRFSPHAWNTPGEVEQLLERLP